MKCNVMFISEIAAPIAVMGWGGKAVHSAIAIMITVMADRVNMEEEVSECPTQAEIKRCFVSLILHTLLTLF